MWIHSLLRVSKGAGRVLLVGRSSSSFGNVPATSNSISSTTLFVSAASRKSWLASSIVPSSVAIPLIERTLSPTCSSPHLQCTLGKKREREQRGRDKEERRKKQPHNQPWVAFARPICYKTHKSSDKSCRSGPKEKVTHTAEPVTVLRALRRSQGSKFLRFAWVHTYFVPKQPILVTFPATSQKKRTLTFLKVTTMAKRWEW